jgi:thymidylate kinase
MTNDQRPLLISFSGLDGSGKSTQITNARVELTALGLRDLLLAFWDNVVVGCRWRQGFVHRVYKSEIGVGALARHGLCLMDALHLCWILARVKRSQADVIILDRYIYDELANLPLTNPLTRAYVRLVAAMVPQPDIAFLLDADPVAANARKPEYPVEFMRENRARYFALVALLGRRANGETKITVIPPLPLEDAKQAVAQALLAKLGRAAASRVSSAELPLAS